MKRRRAKTDSRSSKKGTNISRETASTTLSKEKLKIRVMNITLFIAILCLTFRYKLLEVKKEKLFTNITVDAYKIEPWPKKKR